MISSDLIACQRSREFGALFVGCYLVIQCGELHGSLFLSRLAGGFDTRDLRFLSRVRLLDLLFSKLLLKVRDRSLDDFGGFASWRHGPEQPLLVRDLFVVGRRDASAYRRLCVKRFLSRLRVAQFRQQICECLCLFAAESSLSCLAAEGLRAEPDGRVVCRRLGCRCDPLAKRSSDKGADPGVHRLQRLTHEARSVLGGSLVQCVDGAGEGRPKFIR